MCVQTAEPYIEPPNDVDIETAISEMKNGKATGRDQIVAKLIEEGGKELKVIDELILKILEEQIIPHEWKYGIICPICKKEDVMCDNYKAVTLLCTTHQILASISYVRLVPCTEDIIEEYQGGFRRRSTVDQIFTMTQILKKIWEHNTEVRHLFTDFQAAYDTVWIKEIWSEMHKPGL
jgi:Reverse transcriptase (RNA-dependent DNA polymerase).